MLHHVVNAIINVLLRMYSLEIERRGVAGAWTGAHQPFVPILCQANGLIKHTGAITNVNASRRWHHALHMLMVVQRNITSVADTYDC